MADERISWPELVVLMAMGSGVDPSLRGIVRVVEPEAEHPDGSYRLYRRGRLFRRERPDGQPFAIGGADTMWVWLDGNADPTAFPRATTMWGWPDSALVVRRELDEWRGDDFTRPESAPAADRFLGRDVWRVDLAPPPHKPFPLTLLVDAETGLVLSQRNEGFGSVVEWTELEVGVELADELFDWRGRSLAPPDHEAEHVAEMRRRQEWLAGQGIGAVELSLPVEVSPHEWDDDGSFHASLHAGLSGSVVRRRRSDEPWEHGLRWEFVHRWTDGTWNWALGTDKDLGRDRLETLRRQLGG
jgi:hypothetical protein